ncbi:MAG: tRNA (adenosine(37)-N6)-dimethylallyltransferase MiaA [Candidatus Zixiibacteriota bacterium]
MLNPIGKVLVILGPTGVGKTIISLEVADKIKGEIICADSRQIYRFMDIGTDKPKPEQRKRIIHHLIDVVDPNERFTAADFAREAKKTMKDLIATGKSPIVTGGTGLYIRALTRGFFKGPRGNLKIREKLKELAQQKGKEFLHKKLSKVDPEAARRIHPNNLVRVIRALEVYELTGISISELQKQGQYDKGESDFIKIGLYLDRKKLYAKIEKRVDQMMEDGLLDEVIRLKELGYSKKLAPLKTLGYKELFSYLEGKMSLSEAVDLIKKNTRNYAKRQLTWFKKEEDITWFDVEKNSIVKSIMEKFEKNP